MSLLDTDRKITKEELKKKGFSIGGWGTPDDWKDLKSKSKYTRECRRPIWKNEHKIFEQYFDDYYIYYFPETFTGYVNINRKHIQNHAGYICGINRFNDKDIITIKTNDIDDIALAVETIKNYFKS